VQTASGDAGVPKTWRPIRDALASYLTSDAFTGDERVAEALWFCMSVALQRIQKSSNKRRPKGRRKGGNSKGSGDFVADNADGFHALVLEYANRVREFQRECASQDPIAPPAKIHNMDVRKFKLAADEKVDAVLTSCPYPAVYDYLSFARKVRAGSGAVVVGASSASERISAASSSPASVDTPTSVYKNTTVPGDRNWPEQEAWIAVVADSLRPGGRAAIMVGDGANINTRRSLVAAASKCALRELAGATMKLTAVAADGRTVYNQARTEHLILFEK
jgi:hypothetical protein